MILYCVCEPVAGCGEGLLVVGECGPVQGCILHGLLIRLVDGCACMVRPSPFRRGRTLKPSQKGFAEKLKALLSVNTIPMVNAGAMSCQLAWHKWRFCSKKQDLRHLMSTSELGTDRLGM